MHRREYEPIIYRDQFALYEECERQWGADWRRNYRVLLAQARQRKIRMSPALRLAITRGLKSIFEAGRQLR